MNAAHIKFHAADATQEQLSSPGAPPGEQHDNDGRFGFALVLIFLVFEYSRPQDLVPAIGALRPTLILMPLQIFCWFKSTKFRDVKCPQLTYVLAMLLLLVLHIPFSTNHHNAFEISEDFLLVCTFSVSVILFVDTKSRLLILLRWWLFLALYISIMTIVGHGRAGSNFLADPNDVSLLINAMLPFALCMLVYGRRFVGRLACIAIALVCVAAVVSTSSRGGFVGLLIVTFVLWLLSPRKVLALILMAIMALGTYKFADQKYWDRISTIQATDQGTAKGRIDSWRAAWAMFEDHPLGVGPGNFGIHFPEYQGNLFGTHGMWGRAAHSLWMTLLAELGIPGIIVYGLLFRANWRSLMHLRRIPVDSDRHRLAHLLSIAFLASFAGFFASGTFLSVLFYPHYWYLTAMLVASEKILTPQNSPGEIPDADTLNGAAPGAISHHKTTRGPLEPTALLQSVRLVGRIS
jgi:O-antigen ligase